MFDVHDTAWRTIDSAPKDGTKVLLWTHYGADVGWYFHTQSLNVLTGKASFEHMGWSTGSLQIGSLEPTHWMPLPKAPE